MSWNTLGQGIGSLLVLCGIAREILLGEDKRIVHIVVYNIHVILFRQWLVNRQVGLEA